MGSLEHYYNGDLGGLLIVSIPTATSGVSVEGFGWALSREMSCAQKENASNLPGATLILNPKPISHVNPVRAHIKVDKHRNTTSEYKNSCLTVVGPRA